MNDLPPTALIAIGTITAALIAGAFTYLGLVISKEQKVSEFRQLWIDELRSEIARYCSAYLFLATAYEMLEKDSGHEKDAPSYLKIVEQPTANASSAYAAIVLRLNPDDRNPKFRELNRAFLRELKQARAALRSDQFSTAQEAVDQLQEKARPILKEEWDRVRAGELTFRLAKYGALVVLILAIAVGHHLYSRSTGVAPNAPQAAEGKAVCPQPAIALKCG